MLSRNSVPAGAEHCPVSKTHHIVSMGRRKFAKMRGLCNCIASNPNKLERFPRQVVSTAQYSPASPNSLTLPAGQFRVKTVPVAQIVTPPCLVKTINQAHRAYVPSVMAYCACNGHGKDYSRIRQMLHVCLLDTYIEGMRTISYNDLARMPLWRMHMPG